MQKYGWGAKTCCLFCRGAQPKNGKPIILQDGLEPVGSAVYRAGALEASDLEGDDGNRETDGGTPPDVVDEGVDGLDDPLWGFRSDTSSEPLLLGLAVRLRARNEPLEFDLVAVVVFRLAFDFDLELEGVSR